METLPPLIICGPVIIENNKVLLIRELKTTGISDWFFPGGTMEAFDSSPEATCIREVKEELGLTITIIRELQSVTLTKRDRQIILRHYLAKRHGEIVPGKDIVAWDWFDCKNLPENAAPNVVKIITDYSASL